uniref:nucleophosmin-like n=1 Tax=Jaculus jaculus TaxID=51337 RepID=UPI001E1B1FEB|nr:nucleophosmin-like [Jaculus jaculus]
MEDSLDMDMSLLKPQVYLFGCELKDDKDYHFKVDNDENEHQLSLRMASLGAGAKYELHIIEAETVNFEGNQIKVTLASLTMSVQLTVSLGGFKIIPPVVLTLNCGSGPVLISREHLVVVGGDAESEVEEEEDVKLLSMSGKLSGPEGVNNVPQKKVKLAADEDENEDEDEGDHEDDFDENVAEEKAPAKNVQISNQNGKDAKPSTPRSRSLQ